MEMLLVVLMVCSILFIPSPYSYLVFTMCAIILIALGNPEHKSKDYDSNF